MIRKLATILFAMSLLMMGVALACFFLIFFVQGIVAFMFMVEATARAASFALFLLAGAGCFWFLDLVRERIQNKPGKANAKSDPAGTVGPDVYRLISEVSKVSRYHGSDRVQPAGLRTDGDGADTEAEIREANARYGLTFPNRALIDHQERTFSSVSRAVEQSAR